MSKEGEDDLEQMSLSTRAGILRPLSWAVLRFLRWFESSGGFFDESVSSQDAEEVQLKKVRLYFYEGFAERFSLVIPFVVTILLLLSLDRCGLASFSFPLQAYGLLFDGLGAVILAVGLFRGPGGIMRDTPRSTTGATFGGAVYIKSEPVSATVRNTADGVLGGVLLTTGFAIQFLAVTSLTADIFPC